MSDDCVHCSDPDCDGAVCARCPCLHCVTRRDHPRRRRGIRVTVAQMARDRGTTPAQARADLLAAYHDHHIHRRSTDE